MFSYDYDTAMLETLKRDSELYKAIEHAYTQELFEENGDAIQQHCAGVHMAIHAVFYLGQIIGFAEGVRATNEVVCKDENIDKALEDYEQRVARAYRLMDQNTDAHGDEARAVNDRIKALLKNERGAVKDTIAGNLERKV